MSNDGEQPIINKDAVATYMLVFMIRGLFTNLEFVFAQFPANGLIGDTIFPIVWEAIRNIEECGLRVMFVTADGASSFLKCIKPQKHLVKLCTRPLIHTGETDVISTLCQMYHI